MIGRTCSVFSLLLLLSCVLVSRAQIVGGGRRFVTTTLSDGRQLRGETVLRAGQGTNNTSVVEVNAFLGVQYGAPPTGARRYTETQPAETWTGVRDALRFGPSCIQSLAGWALQSEDCLYLNVYTPAINRSNPVMVWFHGGGWRAGSASYNLFEGTALATKEVVVVTVNYRLGPFGFFTTGDDVMPGNYGMLDQVLALRWVRDNIQAFGGNPNSVTIFGESAGAASCSLHVLSPLSSGLFQRAIMESGSSLNLWGAERPGTVIKLDNFTKQVGERVGCKYSTSDLFLTCLRDVNARNLLDATLRLRSELRVEIPLTPRVETRFGFLPDYPEKLLERGAFNKVDTLRGFNSGEYSYFISDPENNGLTRNEFSLSYERFFGKYMVQSRAHDFLVQFVDRDYLANNTDPFAIRSNLVTAFADTAFGLGSILELQKMLEHGGAAHSHYVYEMDYQTSLTHHPAWMGVLHAGELPLVFMNIYPIPSIFLSPSDRAMGEKVQTLWTNFARTGNPTATRVVDSGADLRWDPYTLTNPAMLKIDLRSNLGPFPRPASLTAYDQFLHVLQESPTVASGNTTTNSNPVGNNLSLG